MVAKKTSRSIKTTPQSPVTPEPKAKVARRRAAAPAPTASPIAPAVAVSPVAKAIGAAWAPLAAPRRVSDEDIRLRAYFLSMEHRGQGSAEYFWHLAERELRGSH